MVPEHETVTTVRLESYYSDYGVIWTPHPLNALHILKVKKSMSAHPVQKAGYAPDRYFQSRECFKLLQRQENPGSGSKQLCGPHVQNPPTTYYKYSFYTLFIL